VDDLGRRKNAPGRFPTRGGSQRCFKTDELGY
jgi:hypothetical protein